jgi:hypothetical protein
MTVSFLISFEASLTPLCDTYMWHHIFFKKGISFFSAIILMPAQPMYTV